MAEDPLCTHTPGKFAGSPLLLASRRPGEGGTLLDPAASRTARVGAPQARHAGAERGEGAPASDGAGGSGGAKPPGHWLERGEGAPASDGAGGSGGAKPPGLSIEYGPESPPTIAWDAAAAARMKKIPAFVRGMVVRAVEESCRKRGVDRVTVQELEQIRARMPTPKVFGADAPGERA